MLKQTSSPILLSAKLISCLIPDVAPIIETLGEPSKEEGGLSFPVQNTPFKRLTAGYELKKYFLGRIYHLVLEGRLAILAPVAFSGTMKLNYSGLLRKGAPFFTFKDPHGVKTPGRGLVRMVNDDQGLREECLRLDLEFLEVHFDPLAGWARVRISPYGGSLIHVFLPPLNYHVKLMQEQTMLLLSVMQRLGQLCYRFIKKGRPGTERPFADGQEVR
ncbi:MAG: DUF3156 family protein [Deltaproteobacteria bacterium]|nr:DUF3156 family protein [Deltaproteobacteria bacterium]